MNPIDESLDPFDDPYAAHSTATRGRARRAVPSSSRAPTRPRTTEVAAASRAAQSQGAGTPRVVVVRSSDRQLRPGHWTACCGTTARSSWSPTAREPWTATPTSTPCSRRSTSATTSSAAARSRPARGRLRRWLGACPGGRSSPCRSSTSIRPAGSIGARSWPRSRSSRSRLPRRRDPGQGDVPRPPDRRGRRPRARGASPSRVAGTTSRASSAGRVFVRAAQVQRKIRRARKNVTTAQAARIARAGTTSSQPAPSRITMPEGADELGQGQGLDERLGGVRGTARTRRRRPRRATSAA